MFRRNRSLIVLGLLLAGFCMGIGFVYANHGLYGLNVLLRRGGTFWIPVHANSTRLSPAMRLALSGHLPEVSAGDLIWHLAAPGFETAELPVRAAGKDIDRILLARIDPDSYRFVVRNAPAGDKDVQDWMTTLGAALVVNGSYYGRDGTPAVPFVSDGKRMGPKRYEARHGAFVVIGGSVSIRDLSHQDWRDVFRGADNAMVSFPMLVVPNPGDFSIPHSRWLANRSFVGQDASGKIIVGTTTDAFFSLDRLSAFLRDSPLGLTIALNLDGGPVAGQGISVGDTKRVFQGRWESQDRKGKISVLTWPYGHYGLPIVLAAIPK